MLCRTEISSFSSIPQLKRTGSFQRGNPDPQKDKRKKKSCGLYNMVLNDCNGLCMMAVGRIVQLVEQQTEKPGVTLIQV